jgi:hypothetical protein
MSARVELAEPQENATGRVLDAKATAEGWRSASRYILGETLREDLGRGFAESLKRGFAGRSEEPLSRAQPDSPALLV